MLPFCIPILPSLAVFEQQLGERSNPKNTASSFYFPRRLWKNTDIGFPGAFPPPKYNIVSRANSSLPILIPRHFPRHHICISVKLDVANVAVNYPRSNSRQRGLAGYINLQDRSHSRSFRISFLFISLSLLLFLSFTFNLYSCGKVEKTITINIRIRYNTNIVNIRIYFCDMTIPEF